MDDYEEKARAFLKESQFHLGDMITEQSHPKTQNFSQTIARDTAGGVDMLLSVDEDILPRARTVFLSCEYSALKGAVRGILDRDRRIFFSGCGSTGRLAILLETLWRRFWTDKAKEYTPLADLFNARAERSCSIMTGGDRALIRSVENFEDYTDLGRRQSKDNHVSPGDLFIAVSEGGETSSVIGTALGAADLGADVFFLYNNPDSVLCSKVERSRNIINDPRVTTVNLTTGPMALSGSTRMQATTMELFVLATALEDVCAKEVAERMGKSLRGVNREEKYLGLYDKLLSHLRKEKNLAVLAGLIEAEEKIYRAEGLVTYISETYLLDIFSDTTERSPTFMLPSFKKRGNTRTVQSWAFAMDPLRLTTEAWANMLKREPRGLTWTKEDYGLMDVPADLAENPPKLDLEEIYSYAIGAEEDGEREKGGALFLYELADQRDAEEKEELRNWYDGHRKGYTMEGGIVKIGSDPSGADFGITLDIPVTEMFVLWHTFFKIIINAVSTGTMGRMGRIRGNWMIQVDATNKKLIDRSCRIISSLSGCSYENACLQLHRLMEENTGKNRKDNRSFVIMALEEREEDRK